MADEQRVCVNCGISEGEVRLNAKCGGVLSPAYEHKFEIPPQPSAPQVPVSEVVPAPEGQRREAIGSCLTEPRFHHTKEQCEAYHPSAKWTEIQQVVGNVNERESRNIRDITSSGVHNISSEGAAETGGRITCGKCGESYQSTRRFQHICIPECASTSEKQRLSEAKAPVEESQREETGMSDNDLNECRLDQLDDAEKAAPLEHTNACKTRFAMDVADGCTCAIAAEPEIIELSEGDQKHLINTLLNPADPNEALRKAFNPAAEPAVSVEPRKEETLTMNTDLSNSEVITNTPAITFTFGPCTHSLTDYSCPSCLLRYFERALQLRLKAESALKQQAGELVRLHERLKVLSFCLTGNDYALFKPEADVAAILASHNERVREDSEEERDRLREEVGNIQSLRTRSESPRQLLTEAIKIAERALTPAAETVQPCELVKLREEVARLKPAAQSSLEVIASLLLSVKWELSPTILSVLRNTHDALLAALAPAPPVRKEE